MAKEQNDDDERLTQEKVQHAMAKDSDELRDFKISVQEFNKRMSSEKDLFESLELVMKTIIKVLQELASLSSGILKLSKSNGAIVLNAGHRTLTLVAAAGTALDSRQKRPRYLYCCQILVFGHLSGQDESRLLSTLRVYADGMISNGEKTFSYRDDLENFVECLSEILRVNLLDSEDIWPDIEDYPQHVKLVAVKEDQADVSDLKNHCIGFACTLEKSK